jgi:hypothetical protein
MAAKIRLEGMFSPRRHRLASLSRLTANGVLDDCAFGEIADSRRLRLVLKVGWFSSL